MTDLNKLRSEFEAYEHSKKPCAIKASLFEVFTKDGLDEDEYSYIGKYVDSFMQEKWELWQKAQAQVVPETHIVVPKDVAKRTIEHIGLAMCHPGNYSYEEKIMEADQVVIERAIEASESGAEK
ncbi:hypothetical protein ABUP55_07555 [Acinetobacter baumannii]|uniref:hypothetical protein n=1 Tax=Acinetobacter baumannii TaxID=470 RepID=UPI00084C0E38